MSTTAEQTASPEAATVFDNNTPDIEGQDTEKGKLFDVPRVTVVLDDSDPTVLKLAISGAIEIDRNSASDVEFFNKLAAGRDVDLEVTAFVAGAKKTHRRDSEGNVDAVVETKTLIVHSVEDTQ